MTSEQGLNYQQMRKSAGLTLAQLAGEVGCSESYLSRIESGQRKGSPWFLAHLAQVLSEVAA